MDSHSIGSRPSATTENNATNLSNDTRPASGPSRRAMLAGMAALPLSACPAPAPARPAGVCAKLAELIDVATEAHVAYDRFYSDTYEAHEAREVAAHTAGGEPCPIPAEIARQEDELCAASLKTAHAVVQFPVTTPADFLAKVTAMASFGLIDMTDQSATLLTDVARLAGKEA